MYEAYGRRVPNLCVDLYIDLHVPLSWSTKHYGVADGAKTGKHAINEDNSRTSIKVHSHDPILSDPIVLDPIVGWK